MQSPFPRAALPAMLAVVVSLGWSQGVAAQEPPIRDRKNTIHIETGPGWSGTLNYERTLTPLVNVRMGGGYAYNFDLEKTSWEFVAMSDLTFFKGHHQLIAGVGAMALRDADYCGPDRTQSCRGGQTEWIPTGEIGYRYRARSGFILRVTIARSPNPATYYTGREDEHLVTPAFSLGWSF